MELFRMTLGVWDYEELRSSSYHWMTLMFFVLFLILVPILLLNMLIAMMGNTYSEIIGKSEREFALQWANILVEIERGLPEKEASKFIDQYTIVSRDQVCPKTTLMVSCVSLI
jgi:transient receptor potential cation channel subfamily V protein 6